MHFGVLLLNQFMERKGGILTPFSNIRSSSWKHIAYLGSKLLEVNINLFSSFKKNIGDGLGSSFSHDIWVGGEPLKDSYRRLYSLENFKDCTVSGKCFNYHTAFMNLIIPPPPSLPLFTSRGPGVAQSAMGLNPMNLLS